MMLYSFVTTMALIILLFVVGFIAGFWFCMEYMTITDKDVERSKKTERKAKMGAFLVNILDVVNTPRKES